MRCGQFGSQGGPLPTYPGPRLEWSRTPGGLGPGVIARPALAWAPPPQAVRGCLGERCAWSVGK